MHRPLVNLNNHAVLVEQERNRNGQIPSAVEQVAVNNVVDTGDFRGGEYVGKAKCLFRCNCSRQDGKAIAQKLRSSAPPRNDRSSCILPARSGKVNSGALRGSMSHVSTDEGRSSSF